MPVVASLDQPAWDQFNAITTAWLLDARTPLEERIVWNMKMRARKLYDAARDPEDMARRLLAIVSKDQQHSRAA